MEIYLKMKTTNKAIATLIDAMGMKSCNDERIANGLSAAYPDSVFTASAGEILNESIDWEQRRYELAKAAMQGFIANTDLFDRFEETGDTMICLCSDSLAYANEMIEQLKGGKE